MWCPPGSQLGAVEGSPHVPGLQRDQNPTSELGQSEEEITDGQGEETVGLD